MSNQGFFGSFELNSMLRGAQLTLVGANRSLQNPALFTSQHYRQAALAILAGIAIRILVAIPTLGIRLFIRFLALFTDLSSTTWDEDIIDGITFVEHSVLQVPFFLMSFMRYLSPTLDNMFMDSLNWVDQTYIKKHQSDDPTHLRAMYYPNLTLYSGRGEAAKTKDPYQALKAFLMRFGRKAALSLGIYLLSFLPYIGKFVLPAASFYTFNKAVGPQAAVVIFGSTLFLPKRYLVMFLQSYFSSRSLMRELASIPHSNLTAYTNVLLQLEPYFARIHYSSAQKRQWFRDREGVLYGFAVAFFVFLKIPLLGVLIYGIAEASTAYLITKITEPPPPPSQAEEFKQKDIKWVNKHEFLSLPLDALDHFNVSMKDKRQASRSEDIKGREFS